MSARLRAKIVNQIKDVLQLQTSKQVNQLANAFELHKTRSCPELHFELPKSRTSHSSYNESLLKDLLHANYDDVMIKAVSAIEKNPSTKKVVFTLQNEPFVQETLCTRAPFMFSSIEEQKQYVVEYSSPNIAKPFHVGHLRSTIIGNFIANLHHYLGNKVQRINYLGDWGTQFGLLNVGIDLMNLKDDEIQKNPIQNLYNAYVEANKQAQSDPSITERARKYFHDLENDLSPKDRVRWEKYRRYTVDELEAIYRRLGVEFDEYAWESQYKQKDIKRVLDRMIERKLLLDEEDGRKVVQVGDRRVPVIKSDGSTLYLVRDIAAIADRYDRYKFDKIFYVVDNGQTDHFISLFDTAAKAIPDLDGRMQHIKFGRIKGMSTRQGTVVFLKDVLDEARQRMRNRQLESTTTKVQVDTENNHSADILGISAVIVNDLKQRRQRDYDFDWENALQAKGDTGIKLQYTYCRLKSLFKNVPVQAASSSNAHLLSEPEALGLIIEIARFHEILMKCEEQLESCILVNYLFGLSNAISRALKRLNIKHESSNDLQQQRLLLFSRAHQILHDGMIILGLKPLEEM